METIQAILAVCGGISVIGGAVAVIHKWISPAINGLSTLFQTNFFRLFFRYCTGV